MGRLVSLNLFRRRGRPWQAALFGPDRIGRRCDHRTRIELAVRRNSLARNAGEPDFFADLLAAQGAKGGLRKGLGRAGQIATMAGSEKLLRGEIP
ncbi:hypothetical protein [Xylella fastidiosa]|uniref:hypothetical protein n=1 Tax=Xylella fastidiosa TaxID=2371 RepID=UPI0039855067